MRSTRRAKLRPPRRCRVHRSGRHLSLRHRAFDPLSTFAADVDTASYDIFRRDINQGMLPQADSVRLEKYVN
jgi:hypothetical protein